MAFVVPTSKGSYEIRESSNTAKGPRSRTLVSFRELTDEVIEKAQEKSSQAPRAPRNCDAPPDGRALPSHASRSTRRPES